MRVGIVAGRWVEIEPVLTSEILRFAQDDIHEKDDRNKKAPEKSGSLFPCTTSKSESTTRVVDRRRLELVAQCELHRARVRQQARILAKVAGVRNREVQRLNVESRKVQHVEHFPSELERVSFGPRHLPTLGKSRIQAGEAVATDR